MSRRLSTILALSAVLLSIAAYIVVRNLPEKPYERQQFDRWTHLNVRSSDLTYIDMIRGHDDRLTFEKVEKTVDGESKEVWTIVRPKVDFTPKESAIRDIAFSMSNLYSENLVTENPEDVATYGLDDPAAQLVVRTKDGEEVKLLIGSKSPTGVAYYMQRAGESTVYTLRKYTVDKIFSDINEFREKTIPVPDVQKITYFRLKAKRTIEIVPMDRDADTFALLSVPSQLKMIKPYRAPRAIDAQRFQETIETIPPSFTVSSFVEDNPADLSRYVLDNPRYEFEMRDSEGESVHLLFGNEADEETVYVKKAQEPVVFTLSKGALGFLQAEPFKLADKFVLIINILNVTSFSITEGDRAYTAVIDYSEYDEEADEGAVYYVNDVEIEEDQFKKFYQKVIGLIADAENPRPGSYPGRSDVTVSFELNDKVDLDRAILNLVQIDKDFYAAYRDGYSEFLVSDYQVEEMFEAAQQVLDLAAEE